MFLTACILYFLAFLWLCFLGAYSARYGVK